MSETFYNEIPNKHPGCHPSGQPGFMPPILPPVQPMVYVDPFLMTKGHAADAQATGLALNTKVDKKSVDSKSLKLTKYGDVELSGYEEAQDGRLPIKSETGLTWVEVPSVTGLEEINQRLDEIDNVLPPLQKEVNQLKDTALMLDDEIIIFGGNADTNMWEET